MAPRSSVIDSIAAVRVPQDRAARRLVDAARLHADEAVLDEVDAADAVVAAVVIQRRQQVGGAQRIAVDRHRVALLETDGDDGRLVGGILRRDGALIDVGRRLDGRVLQHFALRGGVQQVGIDRERGFPALVLGHRNLVLLGEGDQVLAALERPLAPGRDDLDAGLQRVIGELEAHLVVALAGGAVTDGVGAGGARDLDLLLGDERPRDRGAEQVDALVERVGAKHREHVVAHEFLAQVLDVDVLRLDAEHQRLFARGLDLAALAEVGREGHHLGAVGLLQPLQNDRGVEAARIGEHHLLDGPGAFRHSGATFGWRGAVGERTIGIGRSLASCRRLAAAVRLERKHTTLEPAAYNAIA